MQVIYIDILFILNFVMDLLIFGIVGRLSNKKIKMTTYIYGSMIAATLYCATVLIRSLQSVPIMIWTIIIPVIPILILFKPSNVTTFMKHYVLSCVVAWGVGGIGFNIYYILLQNGKNPQMAIWMPVISGIILLVIIEQSMNAIKRKLIRLHYEYEITIVKDSKEVLIKGFLDTGNQLYTLNHMPVSVLSEVDIEPILSETLKNTLELCKKNDPVEVILKEETEKIYLIPFESVGCEHGILIGIVVEKMILKRGAECHELENCIIGISPRPVFENNMYQGLIHPELIVTK
ncbi:MAG: sigma-E processing peptidase SpoIIGA [Cellulosilyticaceae bacterium]